MVLMACEKGTPKEGGNQNINREHEWNKETWYDMPLKHDATSWGEDTELEYAPTHLPHDRHVVHSIVCGDNHVIDT